MLARCTALPSHLLEPHVLAEIPHLASVAGGFGEMMWEDLHTAEEAGGGIVGLESSPRKGGAEDGAQNSSCSCSWQEDETPWPLDVLAGSSPHADFDSPAVSATALLPGPCLPNCLPPISGDRSVWLDPIAPRIASFADPRFLYPTFSTNSSDFFSHSLFSAAESVDETYSDMELAVQPRDFGGFLAAPDQSAAERVELINLLVACVEAIAAGSLTLINHILARLGRLASPNGTSAVHRLAACFTEGLACRVSQLWPQIYQSLPIDLLHMSDEEEEVGAWLVLNQATPMVKFSHFTANDIILEAFTGEEKVHVIDLDIKQGLQWAALLQSLAMRDGGAPQQVRVTGVGECKEEVQEVGDRLAELAAELGLNFHFHAVIENKLEDLRLWMLHVKEEEAVAVNCLLQLHKTLYDATGGAAQNLLALILSTRPKVVALLEQETHCHEQRSLDARFLPLLRHFAAMFDALHASLPNHSAARLKVEALFGRRIRQILAYDGALRRERYQPFYQWRRLLCDSGFRPQPLTHRARAQAQMLLRMFRSSSSCYRLLPPAPAAPDSHHELSSSSSFLTLAWLDEPLFTASAWIPIV